MTGEPMTGEPLPPVTAWRAECNRLVLEANVKAYDRRHGRTSRRHASRTQDPSAASRGAAPAREAITRETAA